jgi:protein TonB
VYKGRKYRTQALHIYGCDEYIEKPIAPEQLLKIVGKFFGSGASAPPPKATEPAPVPPEPAIDPRAQGKRSSTAKPAPSTETPPAESPRTRLTAVPQTIAEDGAEDEIIARLDAILPGGGNASQPFVERETVAVLAAIDQDPFAQMRAELDAELGSLSAALAFEPTLVPSDQAVSPSVLEALPAPDAETQVAPPVPPIQLVPEERPGQVVDFVDKRSRKSKNRKKDRQHIGRSPQVAEVARAPEPVELTLPRGTIVASELEAASERSGMPAWVWAALGLVSIVALYFVFSRWVPNGPDAVPSDATPTEIATNTPPIASEPPVESPPPIASPPPVASTLSEAPPQVTEPSQTVPDAPKSALNAHNVPVPKKSPERVAKPVAAPLPAQKPLVLPPAASEPAKPESPKIEPPKETPPEATPPSGLDDSVAGVETVPDAAPAATTTTIAPGTLIPIDTADTLPVSLTHRLPIYSLQARQLRLSGAVVMNVLVNERGAVDQVVLVTGVAGGDVNDAAVRAAGSWTYRPATKNGVPVKVWKSERIVFKL